MDEDLKPEVKAECRRCGYTEYKKTGSRYFTSYCPACDTERSFRVPREEVNDKLTVKKQFKCQVCGYIIVKEVHLTSKSLHRKCDNCHTTRSFAEVDS